MPFTRKDDPDIVFCNAFSVCISKRARVLVGSASDVEVDAFVGSEMLGGMIALSIPLEEELTTFSVLEEVVGLE